MITFGEMVAETAAHLRSFVRDQEISTHITGPIDDAVTVIEVADAAVVSRGRVEIDDELIWIDSSDKGTTLTIPPYGRGMDGTTAMAHTSGTRVIVSPLYPRSFLKQTLNQTIKQIGAQLYGTESLECVTHSDGNFKYELPDYTRDVLNVKVTDPTWQDDVTFLRDWTFDKSAPQSVSASGKALYLYDDWVGSGVDLRVTISRDPMSLEADSDLFSDSFLPDSAQDLPVLGAAARLLATSDSYDLQTRAIEAQTMNTDSRGGSAAQAQSKYLQALFMSRMEEERLRLLNTNNNRTRYESNGLSGPLNFGWM